MKYLPLILILILLFECNSSVQQVKADRKPFQKSSVKIKSPTEYLKRDVKDGEYDPKPRVVLIDEKTGKYELRWIGYDGKDKIVKYQRADAIDAVVEAKVEKNSEGKYKYEYFIKNLPSSPTYISSFTVQTLADDVKIVETKEIFVGDMSKHMKDFNEGTWRRFAILNETSPKIEAGKSIEFSLISSALPGIVGCRATGGNLTLLGADEHIPQELENVMPGVEEWATGYTLGPVERLASMNSSERAKYVLENLPKFLKAGWITERGLEKYQLLLKREELKSTLEEAKKDFEKGYITSEVFYIIEGLNF